MPSTEKKAFSILDRYTSLQKLYTPTIFRNMFLNSNSENILYIHVCVLTASFP